MTYVQEDILPYDSATPKGQQVERMFDAIAHSYDQLNHWLSLGIDRRWRQKSIDALRSLPHRTILDLATGTGDFALLAQRRLLPESIMACDLSENMMQIGREKVKKAGLEEVIFFKREDGMKLSFSNETFDAVTIAYGVRNYQDLDQGLREIHRVLRPGGHAVILELTAPHRQPMRSLFWLYSHAIMPTIGRLISKDRSAYRYLPATMEAFPQGEVMVNILSKAGFSNVKFKRFTFGLSTMYLAAK